MRSFFLELRRRDVLRMAAIYIVGAWIVIQVADTAFPGWSVPESSIRFVWIAAFLGFPIALLFSWNFDITAQGIQRTPSEHEETTDLSLKTADRILIVALSATAITIVSVLTQSIVETRQIGPDASIAGHPVVPAKSVAVLAFADLSQEGGQEWFSDGLTEEILNSLARLPELKVTARTSAFHFKGQNLPVPDIAARLGVRYVVEGSVRRSGDALRVTYQLIHAVDGFHVHSDSIDTTMRDVIEVQENIAEKIASALNIVLDDEKRKTMFALGTRDVEAYEHFLRGRKLLYEYLNDSQHEKMWRAKEWFEKAFLADPRFAAAYALHSHAYLQFLDGVLPSPVPPSEMNDSITFNWALEQYMSNVSNVIAYAEDPGLRLVSEFDQVLFSDDWSALPQLAEQVDPETLAASGDVVTLHHVGFALGLLRMTDQALTLAEFRIERNPLSPLPFNAAWRASNVAGDTSQAIEYLEQGLATVGKSMFLEFHMLLTQVAANDMDEAVRLAEDPDWGVPEYHESMLAFVYAAAGRDDDARRIVESLSVSNRQNIFIALMLVVIGEHEEAKRLFGVLDAWPSSQLQFMSLVTAFQSRVPYDISWTPNFASRVAEAGVTLETFEFPRSEGGDGAQVTDEMPY